MKRPQIILTAFLTVALATALSVAGCKKNSGSVVPAKFTGCRITQMAESGTDTTQRSIYSFSYNADGKVYSITTTSAPATPDAFVRTFSYGPNYIVAIVTDDGAPSSKDSLALDGQNRVINIDHDSYNGGSFAHQVYETYQYDSLGNLALITYHNYATLSSGTYQWQNGDLLWSTSGNGFYSYVYGTAVYNTGNITAHISDMETYGRAIYSPLHVYCQVIYDSTDVTNYAYTLDTSGKIISVLRTTSDGYQHITRLSYECE